MPLPRLAAAALAAITVAAPAVAAPITSSEPPDYPTFFLPVDLGTLGLGANTIAGGLRFVCRGEGCSTPSGDPNDREDSFVVSLAAGQRITAITASITNYTSPSGESFARFSTFADRTTLALSAFRRDFGNGMLSLFSGSVDGAGTFAAGFRPDSPEKDGTYALDYLVTITVEAVPTPPPTPVPEPASLALLGLGLAGLVAARRRRGV